MSVWVPLAVGEPPEAADVVFGWWCYWPDSISWEISDDRPDCATHWCVLPMPPGPDLEAAAKARSGEGL